MIVLGIASEHCSSACLMIDGRIVGMIQEERFSKRKNQTAFPLQSIRRLVAQHLEGKNRSIDRVVFGGRESDPYYAVLDRFTGFSVADHVREQHELWYPYFYGAKRMPSEYWTAQLREGRQLNPAPNYDFSWLAQTPYDAAIRHFCEIERPAAVRRHLGFEGQLETVDHHTCHAYYALYGAPLAREQRSRSLVLTADAWGDGNNWSASVPDERGQLTRLAAGPGHGVARIYKWTTLILGMKPNEEEYKVMGLSGYSRSRRHIEAAERVFFEALDFRDGKFTSDRPLVDSYFDLKNRLEGHRFDNIAAALQNWASTLTCAWAQHWLRQTERRGLCFSGGLSMNIKINGDLLNLPNLDWLSVPASGGDESICAGACFALAADAGAVEPMAHAYLGERPQAEREHWSVCLADLDAAKTD